MTRSKQSNKVSEVRWSRSREDSAAERLPRNSMQLRIFIDIYSYEFFIEHLCPQSMSWAAINRATLLGRTRVVECDLIEAEELLLCARKSYPSAIPRISEGICKAGLTP